MTQAASFQEIWDENLQASSDQLELFIVNKSGYESGLDEMAEVTSRPVLQDTTADGVFDDYGASQWYIYLVDREGITQTLWYALDLDGERDRLLGEIETLVGAR